MLQVVFPVPVLLAGCCSQCGASGLCRAWGEEGASLRQRVPAVLQLSEDSVTVSAGSWHGSAARVALGGTGGLSGSCRCQPAVLGMAPLGQARRLWAPCACPLPSQALVPAQVFPFVPRARARGACPRAHCSVSRAGTWCG